MNRSHLALVAALLLLPCLDAAAAAQRTFVSTAGNDANTGANCSLASPCRSFASALTVTGTGGEIVVLDSGGYGPVTIDKSVSIIAPSGVYAGISVTTDGIGVKIAAAGINALLHGITITGTARSGQGIVMSAGARLTVQRCEITKTLYGMVLNSADSDVFINDTSIIDNLIGVEIREFFLRLTIDRSRFEGNFAGLQGAGAGYQGSKGPAVVVSNSTFARNEDLAMWFSPGTLTVSDTRINDNLNGITVAGDVRLPGYLRLIRCVVTGNAAGFEFVGIVYATIADSLIAGHTSFGIATEGDSSVDPPSLTISGNRITDNKIGILVGELAELRTAQNNTIDRNVVNIKLTPGGIVTPISGL